MRNDCILKCGNKKLLNQFNLAVRDQLIKAINVPCDNFITHRFFKDILILYVYLHVCLPMSMHECNGKQIKIYDINSKSCSNS